MNVTPLALVASANGSHVQPTVGHGQVEHADDPRSGEQCRRDHGAGLQAFGRDDDAREEDEPDRDAAEVGLEDAANIRRLTSSRAAGHPELEPARAERSGNRPGEDEQCVLTAALRAQQPRGQETAEGTRHAKQDGAHRRQPDGAYQSPGQQRGHRPSRPITWRSVRTMMRTSSARLWCRR